MKTRRPGTVSRDEWLSFCHGRFARGQDLPQAKLLDLDVVQIRSAMRQRENLRKHIKENLSNEALAKKHGVHIRTIEKISTYESWGHIV